MPEQTRPRLVKQQVVSAAEILGDDPSFWEQSNFNASPETRLRVEEITEPGDEHVGAGFYKAGRTVRLSVWDPGAEEPRGERPTPEPFMAIPDDTLRETQIAAAEDQARAMARALGEEIDGTQGEREPGGADGTQGVE